MGGATDPVEIQLVAEGAPGAGPPVETRSTRTVVAGRTVKVAGPRVTSRHVLRQTVEPAANTGASVAVSDGIRRYRTVSDGIGRYRTVSDGIGRYRTVSDGIGRYRTLSDVIRRYQTLSDVIRRYSGGHYGTIGPTWDNPKLHGFYLLLNRPTAIMTNKNAVKMP